jgi:hypothetical protein
MEYHEEAILEERSWQSRQITRDFKSPMFRNLIKLSRQ